MPTTTESTTRSARLSLERQGTTLLIRFIGKWRLSRSEFAPLDNILDELSDQQSRKVAFDSSQLAEWDSSLLTVVDQISNLCRSRSIEEDRSGLPDGVKRLLELAESVPESDGARDGGGSPGMLALVGTRAIKFAEGTTDFFTFLGDVTIALGRLVIGRARFRGVDMLRAIQDCGVNAFGIVTLISFLVGVILAFMGAVQLEQFGASIYVADLVAIGIARDMGAMMTAIIMAGRTGAAFAAQLGTMKVTQEIDALTTMGVSPIEFLVLPRVVALFLMMPLLCLYSDFVGLLGGAAVGAGMLGLSFNIFLQEAFHALTLGDVAGGVFKATVYGIIVGVAGCLRGFQCGNSSSAVGDAATAAVVSGIVYIVAACGLFAVIFNILGF